MQYYFEAYFFTMTAIIIEDDFNWKLKLQLILDELGIIIIGIADSIASANELLKKNTPNFILSDVILNTELIFDLFKLNREYCKIPTIFITSSQKEKNYEDSSIVKNHLYIIKPAHKLTLKSAIETLCGNINGRENKHTTAAITIKGKYNQKIELAFEKIMYINQNQHYCTIYTAQQHFVIKKSLVNIMKDLDDRFLQIHRSYCVNINFIENFGIGLELLKLKDLELPIGLTFKEKIKQLIAEKFSVK